MSAGKYYNLKEIPFEPTGAAEIKYGYEPPKNFDLLEENLKNTIREQKLHVILLNSPLGGGKSATISEFGKRITEGKYCEGKSILIVNKLLNLEINNYVSDFLKETTSMTKKEIANFVSNTKPVLRDKIIEILTDLNNENKIIVWIIDEFDILADRPEHEQRSFLQFLREIIDQIAKLSEQRILFIMAHTAKSATDFYNHIKSQHGPFVSRIVDTIKIGYDYEEVKNIIFTRLNSVSIIKRKNGDISPFSEKGLRKIYDLINSLSDSNSLTNFRLLERICYNAIIKGEKENIERFDDNFLVAIFEEQYSFEQKVESKLSYQLRSALSEMKQNQIHYNEAILNGLVEGLTEARIRDFKIIKRESKYLGLLRSEKISLAMINIQSQYNKQYFLFSIYLATPISKSIITSDDFYEISNHLKQIIDTSDQFNNKSIFLYLSNFDIDINNLEWCDYQIRIDDDLADDFAALSKAINLNIKEDIPGLLKGFNAEITPIFNKIINQEINDLTYSPSERIFDLINTLFIASFSNNQNNVTKNDLKEKEKMIFGKASKASDSQIKELVNLGFAKEEGSLLIPNVPKAIKQFIKKLKKSPLTIEGIQDYFEELIEPLLLLCLYYNVIKIEENLVYIIYLDDLLKDAKEKIISIKQLLEKYDQDKVFKKSQLLFLSAFDNAIEKDIDLIQYIAIKNIDYFYKQIIQEDSRFKLETNFQNDKNTEESTTVNYEKVQSASSSIDNISVIEEKIPKAIDKKPLESAILELIINKGPIKLSQLNAELNDMGYKTDTTSVIIKLILSSKILLVNG